MGAAMRGGAERRGTGSLVPWGLARVRGDSMLPTLRPGDRLLVRYAATPRPGDVVVAVAADRTLTVKRAVEERHTASGAPGWWLLSDNAAAGIDSRHRGPVPAGEVLGVVRLRLWPRPRCWRSTPSSRRTTGRGAVED